MAELKQEYKDQYDRLINARNFHYENLNRWLSFFYIAIAAIFAGFCTLQSSEIPVSHILEIVIIAVLYMISLCAYLSGKGYYYWENQWIILLQNFEKKHFKDNDKDQRIYSVFANKELLDNTVHPVSGANFSTTKVALLMTLLLTILWGAMLIYWIVIKSGEKMIDCKRVVMIFALLGSILGTIALVIVSKLFLKSDLRGLRDLKLTIEEEKE